MARMWIDRAGLAAVVVLALAACGGGDDDADDPASEESVDDGDDGDDARTSDDTDSDEAGGASDDVGDEAGTDDEAAAVFPVEGGLVTVLDFGLGVYAIDGTDGSSAGLTLPGDDEENPWFADRNRQPFVLGDRGHTLLERQIPDADFVNEFALGELDLTTGTASIVAEFGPTRESAESTDNSSWELHGAGGDVAWLTRYDSGETSSETLFSTSLTDGSVGAEAVDPLVEQTDESGSTCSFSVQPVGVDSAGTLVVSVGGTPAEWDGSGIVETIPVCFGERLVLPDFTDDPMAFVTTPDGAPLPPEAAERLVDADITATGANSMYASDDAVWWIFGGTRFYLPAEGEQVDAMVGGVARLDRATGEIEVFPLGDLLGEFVEQNESGGWQTTMLSGDLQELNGALWIMDSRDNGPLIRVDQSTGAVGAFEVPVDPVGTEPDPESGDGPSGTTGVGSRYTTAEFVPGTDGQVWLSVTRWTITSEDENGASASGPNYVDQVDATSGEVVRSVPEDDLTGVGF